MLSLPLCSVIVKVLGGALAQSESRIKGDVEHRPRLTHGGRALGEEVNCWGVGPVCRRSRAC